MNPAATGVTARAGVAIAAAFAARHDLEVVETAGSGHATELAREAAAGGSDVVAVLGGDGTLNEAANGLLGTACALAALPGGSTNVFARTIGLPNRLEAAVELVLDALDRGSIGPAGLGMANGRAFLFHAGLGFDAAVVQEAERHRRMKRRAARSVYAAAAIDTWVRGYDRRRPQLRVEYPDGSSVTDAFFVVVLNTDPYTYVGSRPLHLAPHTSLDTKLAAVAMRSLSPAALLRVTVSALAGGDRVRSRPSVAYRADLDAVRVTGRQPFPYQLDGEPLGLVNEVAIHHLPDAIQLVLPAAGRRPA